MDTKQDIIMDTKQENLIKLKEIILTIHNDKLMPDHFDEKKFSDNALDLLYYYRIGAFLKARRFYNQSRRVYLSYNFFPYPIAQIHRAVKVNADKLIKVGRNDEFIKFINETEKIMYENFDFFNDIENYSHKPSEKIDFKLVTNEIIDRIANIAKPNKSVVYQN